MKSFHLEEVLLIFLFVMSELRGVPLEERSFHRHPVPKSAVTPIPLFKNTLENIPKLSEGHKQYQFYNMGFDGDLHKQWMSLQEVQNIILAYAMTRQVEGIAQSLKMVSFSDQSNDDLQGKFGFGLPVLETKKPQRASIDDVLANVQKVMSKEITNQLLSTEKTSASTTMISKEVNENKTNTDMPQNITIPDTILAHLMKEQVESLETHSPWGIISPNPSTEIFNGVFNTDTSMTPTPNVMVDDEISQENFILEDIITTTERNPDLRKKDSTNKNMQKNSLHNTAITEEDKKKVTKLPMLESDSATRIENLEKFISNVLSAEPSLYDKPSYTVIPVKDLDENDPMKLSILTTTEEYLTTLLNGYQKTSEELISELIEKFNSTIEEQSKTTQSPNNDITISTVKATTTTPKITRTTSSEEPRTVSQIKIQKKSQIELTTKPFNDPTSITTNAIKEESSTSTMLKKITSTTSAKKSTTEVTTKRNHKTSTTSTRNPETSTKKAIKHKPESEKHNSKSSSSAGHMKDVSNSPTNVLTPLEMAPLSFENLENLGVLQDYGGFNDDLYDYAPVYLEDISETNYNDNVETSSEKAKSNDTMSEILDFPSQHNTDSYGKPDDIVKTDPDDYADVDPTQFLPSHNPELAKGENPLRKTPFGNEGLEKTVLGLKPEVRGYVNAMNDIAFQIYKKAAKIHRRQNLVMSPLNLISSLSMLTLGARGSTAEMLSQLLRADDFIMFNPHQLLKNITETVLKLNKIGHEVAFVNNIFIEEPEVKPYDVEFFSRTVDYFYNSSVQQIAAQDFGTIARDLANEAVRKQTLGAVQNFLKPKASLKVLGPLSVVSSAYFQANWIIDIKEEDIFDMNFIRFPSAERRRRLIRTVGLNRRMTLNAGYSDELDATVTEIPLLSSSKEISLILVMPGQQKRFIANGLSKLEQDLTSNSWRKMLKSVIPHNLHFKMPIFSHRNYLNLSSIFSTMELDALLQNETDFSGINGAKELRLGDAVQLTEFHSCKLNTKMFAKRSLDSIQEPISFPVRNPNKDEDARRPRGIEPGARAILPGGSSDHGDTTSDGDKVLSFDRAFFYVLRHNPTGLVLFIGRYLDPETF